MAIIDFLSHLKRRQTPTYFERADAAYDEIKDAFMALYPKYAGEDVAIWALLKLAADVVRVGRDRDDHGEDWAKHAVASFVDRARLPT